MSGVSVIICCYNAAKRIVETLEALQCQRQGAGKLALPWEVILVDNNSVDDTAAIARECWERGPITDLHIISEPNSGLMFARIKGLSVARFDIVSFIDDDNRVEEEWVAKVYEVFEDPVVGACGGRGEASFEEERPEWFSEVASGFAVGKQADSSGYVDDARGYLWGAGLSFRKSIWEELQMRHFEPQTVGRQGKNISAGEDSELCYAFRLLGYKLYYRDDLLFTHFMPKGRMNIPYVIKMTTGFGRSSSRLNIYRKLLNPAFPFHAWWREWLAAWKSSILLSVKLILIKDGARRRKLLINRAYSLGYASQIWQDRNTLALRRNKIKATFSIH